MLPAYTGAVKSLELRSANAVVDITPPHQLDLGANDAPALPWAGVRDPLEANLSLLTWGDSQEQLLLVTLDVLYASYELRDAIVRASGLPSERVIVAASHTHRGPMIDATKPRLGAPDSEYTKWLTNAVSSAVRDLKAVHPVPTTVTAASAMAAHSINRRRHKRLVVARRPRVNAVVNAPNPSGATDETVVTLSLRDPTGRTVAAFWNYACHPVAGPRSNSVSAHFPGEVREAIRAAETSERLPVLYFQGFSGNTRPSASTEVHSVRRRVRQLLSGPLFENMTESSYGRWAQGLASVVLRARASEEPVATDEICVSRVERPASEFYEPAGLPVSFVGLRLGRDFQLVGVSGELVAEYADLVRERSGARYVMCAGCIDQPFGYVPTTEMIAQGGYEAGGFCKSFSLENLNPKIEIAVRIGFSEVMRESAP